jgi:hypothetical protein
MTTTKIAIVDLAATKSDPVLRRREQCVAKLLDQQKLLADPKNVKVTQRWKGKGAARKATDHRTVIRPWWTAMLNGVAMRLRFIPGRQGVVVASIEELSGAIDQIVEQIKTGDLDAMIMPAAKHPTAAGKNAKPLHAPVKPPAKVAGGKRRAA